MSVRIDAVSHQRQADLRAAGLIAADDASRLFYTCRGREVHFPDDNAVGLLPLLAHVDQFLLELGDWRGLRGRDQKISRNRSLRTEIARKPGMAIGTAEAAHR